MGDTYLNTLALVAIVVGLVIAIVLPKQAQSQEIPCIEWESAKSQLETVYGETRKSISITKDLKSFVEVYANEDTGSWTIVITGADGMTCQLVDGVGYAPIEEEVSAIGEGL